jgi:MEDS: MEthanogen/methylotroph, DcmR Sensory domain
LEDVFDIRRILMAESVIRIGKNVMRGSLELPTGQHAMLLYNDNTSPDSSMIKYVNEALKRGHLVAYMPIDSDYESSKSRMAAEITDYEEHVDHGNLFTLNSKPFYETAVAGSTDLFEELKVLLEEMIQERIDSEKGNKVVLHSGCAADLTLNDKFDECIILEKWWQRTHAEWMQKGLDVTLFCPHSNSKLNQKEFSNYRKGIASLHTITQEAIHH